MNYSHTLTKNHSMYYSQNLKKLSLYTYMLTSLAATAVIAGVGMPSRVLAGSGYPDLVVYAQSFTSQNTCFVSEPCTIYAAARDSYNRPMYIGAGQFKFTFSSGPLSGQTQIRPPDSNGQVLIGVTAGTAGSGGLSVRYTSPDEGTVLSGNIVYNVVGRGGAGVPTFVRLATGAEGSFSCMISDPEHCAYYGYLTDSSQQLVRAGGLPIVFHFSDGPLTGQTYTGLTDPARDYRAYVNLNSSEPGLGRVYGTYTNPASGNTMYSEVSVYNFLGPSTPAPSYVPPAKLPSELNQTAGGTSGTGGVSGGAQAQGDENTVVAGCVDIPINLTYGSRDETTGGAVSQLQDFLQANNYLNTNPTGFFGTLTLAAVKQFQAANGIESTGFVGPITRAKIKSMTCQ